MTDPPQVHQAIAAVIEAMPGIGKDSEMGEGGYKYRGIEKIKSELKPLLAEHGLYYAPHSVRESVDTPYQTKNGATWQRSRLTVTYRFYGRDGSFIEAEARGEGADNSDKASNKAMTSAEKQVLLQVFCVADTEDPDKHRPEEQVPGWEVKTVKGGIVTEIEKQLNIPHEKAVELGQRAWAEVGDDRHEWTVNDAQDVIEAAVNAAARLDGMDTAVGGDEG